MNLEEKSALVVGGTAGIGLATAKRLVAYGARVAIAGRSGERGRAAAAALGEDAMFCEVDVRRADDLARAVASVAERWGRLDIAFNNAGWEGVAAPLEDIADDDWATMVDLKLGGVWRGMREEIRQMRAQGGAGAIVNMAGNWGLVGFPRYASYCAAAHGIVGLTRAAALEVAAAGIRVNAVCPGAVDAPMLDRMVGGDAAVKASFGEALAIGRLCSEDEVAEAVCWLASPGASYVNGAALPLDGGT